MFDPRFQARTGKGSESQGNHGRCRANYRCCIPALAGFVSPHSVGPGKLAREPTAPVPAQQEVFAAGGAHLFPSRIPTRNPNRNRLQRLLLNESSAFIASQGPIELALGETRRLSSVPLLIYWPLLFRF